MDEYRYNKWDIVELNLYFPGLSENGWDDIGRPGVIQSVYQFVGDSELVWRNGGKLK